MVPFPSRANFRVVQKTVSGRPSDPVAPVPGQKECCRETLFAARARVREPVETASRAHRRSTAEYAQMEQAGNLSRPWFEVRRCLLVYRRTLRPTEAPTAPEPPSSQ